jgi:hypothetical protein
MKKKKAAAIYKDHFTLYDFEKLLKKKMKKVSTNPWKTDGVLVCRPRAWL